ESDGFMANGKVLEEKAGGGLFKQYQIPISPRTVNLDVTMVKENKAKINVRAEDFEDVKELLLQIDYVGDIGYAFIDGELIHDNFCNNDTWDVGLKVHEKKLVEKGMYVNISPIKGDSLVKSDSQMAARTEIDLNQIAHILYIRATPVPDISISDVPVVKPPKSAQSITVY